MAEYISKNQGLLSTEMVKTGDKLVILEVSTYFSEKQQLDKWNIKVELPNKLHKLYSPMDNILDAMADKWGKETDGWIGHTLEVEIKTSKRTNNPYIFAKPTDDPKVVIEKKEVKVDTRKVEYPTEDINPNDIPF